MAPTLRPKKSTTGLEDSSPPSTTIVDSSQPAMTTTTTGFQDLDNSSVITSDRFEMLLRSIQANQLNIDNNQATIQALISKLDRTSSVLENTSKRLLDLSDQVESINLIVSENIPQEIQSSIASAKNDLHIDFSTTIANFSTKVYQDLNTHHSESIQCFKSQATNIAHLASDGADLSKTLSFVQDSTLSKLDVERIVVQKWQDELNPHIQSHYDLQKEVTTRFSELDTTIQSTIDNHPIIQQFTSTSSPSTIRPRPPTQSSFGFHQSDSKDFSVSKLQKELKDIKLFGHTLKELEIFWDAILRAFTNLCKNQPYPYYRDLRPSFDFHLHLVGDIMKTKLSQLEYEQGSRNYKSFSDVLRLFLFTHTTISEETCPKVYLRLLSLCDLRDGFKVLQELIFSSSPQLSGDYYDYRTDIAHLNVKPGEQLSKFYQRVIALSTEIQLANIPNGDMAELAQHYISILRSTQCPTIIGILTPYWKQITTHRRDPKHLSKPLPWTFKEVYDDLINSNIFTIPSIGLSSTPSLSDPIVARGSTKPVPTTVKIHHTKNGRRFLTLNKPSDTHSRENTHERQSPHQPPPCTLCLNKHVNPWHGSDSCPYKHPTHILPKDVRERVMQHNALHGAEKRDFSKDQDTPDQHKQPPQDTGHSAITPSEEFQSPDTQPIIPTNNIQSTPTDVDPDLEIIETEYFDLPTPPATANKAVLSPTNDKLYSDVDPDEIITDHLQYISYYS